MGRLIRVMVISGHPVLSDGLRFTFSCTTDMVVACEARAVADIVRDFDTCKPDLALVDLQLPMGEGKRAVRVLRNLSDSIPIVVLTTHRGEGSFLKSANGGGPGMLTEVSKRLSSIEIVAAAREAVHRSQRGGGTP
jgi:DNA-binding NarL/FixJ family response regulator